MGQHARQDEQNRSDSIETEHEKQGKAMHEAFYGRKAGNKGCADDSDRANKQETEIFQIFKKTGRKQSAGISAALVNILKKIV